ncbi:zf-HC2 domain-containing protein [Allonocardiopsis opalescens]|uniref:zf-HC2 domain-containing protein n=1 Tax=Allonocardiopsis opalescens TaxID=1144618 RepID=UPI0011B1C77C|nr:zf-HC2 domain-containing protein [Allonocardiopsis opalescens]
MSHLGERLSALVDDELGHSDREWALSHLAKCEACRFEAEMLRRLKRRLNRLDGPEPSMDFLGRLSSMTSGSTDDPPTPPMFPGARPPLGSSAPLGASSPFAGRTPDGSGSARPSNNNGRLGRFSTRAPIRWSRTRYAVAGASLVALTLGTAFVATGDFDGGSGSTPGPEDYAVEGDGSTEVPFWDPSIVTALTGGLTGE